MRKIILQKGIILGALLVSNFMRAQDLQINPTTNKYEIVVEKQFSKIESKKLFDATSEWLALNFNGLNSSLKYSNFEKRRIIFTGSFELKRSVISFVLHFTIVDNKYKCIITDFIAQSFSMNGLTLISRIEEKMLGREKYNSSIEEQIKAILDVLNTSIVSFK